MIRVPKLIALCALALFFAPCTAQAATVTASIAGQTFEVPVHYVPEDNGGMYRIGTPTRDRIVFETDEGSITLEGALDPDPSIDFAVAVIDFGAPSVFGFTFITPLTPPFPNPSVVFDSLAGSVTNGATAGGVTVTALAPPAGIPVDGDGITELQVYTLSDDGGLTWKNVGLDAGPTTTVPLGPFASGTYGVFNQGPIPTIAGGPWTHMRADLSFGLSGGGDAFVLSGAKVLVPEPSCLVIGLSTVILLCLFRSRAVSKT
jgi:hypothetical protein